MIYIQEPPGDFFAQNLATSLPGEIKYDEMGICYPNNKWMTPIAFETITYLRIN